MSQLTYTPDPQFKVHPEGVIRLLCSDFQSHEAGLPEWVKNASDAYGRDGTDEEGREIVLIFDHNRRASSPIIACLDLCGMDASTIEEHFRHWGSPDAATGGGGNAPVQGGHGNGGKCYMIQMFREYALVHTARDGRVSRYGVPANTKRFGYVPDPSTGRDYAFDTLGGELARALKAVNCSLDSLPVTVQSLIPTARGFSLFVGVAPVGYDKRIPVQQLVQSLVDHPQMIRSLELCRIRVLVNGKLYENGSPLTLRPIAPLPGADSCREIVVPRTLTDPVSGSKISTQEKEGTGLLRLFTSGVSMRWKKKYRHNIIYRTSRQGVIGFMPVLELDIQSSYRDHIFGDVTLDALEELKQNSRRYLADAPLSRAVNSWVSNEIQKYAKEFEARDRQERAHEERDAVSKMNAALDRWKNRFLREMGAGFFGEGAGGGKHDHQRLPSGKVARMEMALSHKLAGVGVALRPTLRFFDSSGQQIRSVAFRWISDDANVAWVDEDLGVVNTFSRGKTKIWAETLDGKNSSNKAELEVVGIHEIRLEPRDINVPVGSRSRIAAHCLVADGYVTEGVYLVWTEGDPTVARVSSAGLVFAYSLGATEVTAGDDKILAAPVTVRVSEGGEGGDGGRHGRGFPLILVSGGFDKDPDTGEEVNFSADAPPVAQRPQDVDRNVWWINSSAPLAQLYLDKTAGYGFDAREWRMYHLERVIEVILQIALTVGAAETAERLSSDEWIIEWGNKASEIQAAAVADLRTFIATGELPAEQEQ